MEILFHQLNPWWDGKTDKETIIRPKYLDIIKKEIDTDLILFLTGLRRVGKTTLMKQAINYLLQEKKTAPCKILFLNLDHIEFLDKTIHDLINEYKKLQKIAYDDFFYLFLDEVASKENFEQELKNLVDIGNIKIVCSSSIASTMNDRKAYLTGRTKTIEVRPLDFEEYLLFKNIQIKKFDNSINTAYFEDYMHDGGIPKYVLEKDIDYLNELITSILYKDVIAVYKIQDEKNVKELVRLLCQRIGKPTSYNKLAKILKISDDTVKKYITYLEKTFLFYSIEKYSKSVNENITAPKKYYIADLGIKHMISGNKEKGPDFENLVFLRITDKKPYYLSENRAEIDFITKDSLIEAKYNSKMSAAQLELFSKVKRKTKIVADDHNFFFQDI